MAELADALGSGPSRSYIRCRFKSCCPHDKKRVLRLSEFQNPFLFDRKLLHFLSNKNPSGDAHSRDKKMSLMRPRSARGAVAPKTATNPMAEIHALHGIAAIGL